MQIAIKNGKIYLRFPFNLETVKTCKAIGMKWVPMSKSWSFPDKYLFRKTLWDVFRIQEMKPPKSAEILPVLSPYLMQHQKDAVWHAIETERHLFGHDTGVGKTLLGIELIKIFRMKTLVVCPLAVIENAWMSDQEKFAPDLQLVNLWDIKKFDVKLPYLKRKDVHCVVNFEGFKGKLATLKALGFEMVMVDESSKIKNPKSQITKDLIDFCDDMRRVYLFSGTPAPNNRLEYYPQARIVSPTIFGSSFYNFRGTYFYPTGYGGYKWVQKKETEGELNAKIASFVSFVRKEDVLGLPERTDNVRQVELSRDELIAYRQMVKDLVVELQEAFITAPNAASKIMKLRQITAGFIYATGDDDKRIPMFIGSSKLTAMMDLVDEIGRHQVVIWTQFIEESKRIAEALQESGKTISIANGLVPQKDRQDHLRRFIDGDSQYLIAHPRSIGHGITLTNCSYAIYTSVSHSHEEHYQSRDRIYRKGQKNACSYYYLVCPGSVDGVMLNCLRQKGSLEQELIRYIKQEGKK